MYNTFRKLGERGRKCLLVALNSDTFVPESEKRTSFWTGAASMQQPFCSTGCVEKGRNVQAVLCIGVLELI